MRWAETAGFCSESIVQWAPSWGREGGKTGVRLEFQADLDCYKSQERLEEFGQTLFSSVIDASSCEISFCCCLARNPLEMPVLMRLVARLPEATVISAVIDISKARY